MNLDMYIQMLNLYFYKEVHFKPYKDKCIICRTQFFDYDNVYWNIVIKPTSIIDTHKERETSKFLLYISIFNDNNKESFNYIPGKPIYGYDELFKFISNFVETLSHNNKFLETNTIIKEWLDKCNNPIKDNRIVNDFTFARRLLSYLESTESYAMTGPHRYEEYNYLKSVAGKLLDYQKKTATDEEEVMYFKGQMKLFKEQLLGNTH